MSELNEIKNMFSVHEESDKENFGRIFDELKKITENHLHHIERDINIVRTDLVWIKRFFWLVTGIAITSIGGAFFGLILK